jgi:hypothetical protein
VIDDPNAVPPGQPLPPTDFPSPGAPYGYVQQPALLYGRETNGIAIAAGVCGIIAVVLCWIPFIDYLSIVLGVLAIIFGVLGVRRADAYGSGRGMAITGIVCGSVGLAIAFLFLLLIYAVVTTVTAIGDVVT